MTRRKGDPLIQVKVTRTQRKRYREVSRAQGFSSMSEWVRAVLDGEAADPQVRLVFQKPTEEK